MVAFGPKSVENECLYPPAQDDIGNGFAFLFVRLPPPRGAFLLCRRDQRERRGTRRPVLQRNHSAQPRLCCVSKQKPNKAALMQTVSISVHGQDPLAREDSGFDVDS